MREWARIVVLVTGGVAIGYVISLLQGCPAYRCAGMPTKAFCAGLPVFIPVEQDGGPQD